MKKKIAMLLVAAMAVTSLCACGSTSSASGTASETASETEAASETETASDAGAASETASETADAEVTTVEDGVLIMATNAAFPPYEYYDGDNIVGIDAEIAQAIADKLGLTLQIDDMEFGSIITSIQTGKADIGAAGMTVTEDRLQNVNFSDTYSTGVQVIVVAEDSDIASVDDLEGKLIGVQENTTGHIYCEDDYGTENVSAFPKGADAITALKNNQVDAVVIDNEPAKAFVAANDGLKILDTAYVTEDYAIAISKDNEALLDAVNAAMAELKADGTLQSIIDKYITAE